MSASTSYGPDDTGDIQDADFVVDAHFLRTADQQIAVFEHAGHDGRDEQNQLFGPFRRALALRLGVRTVVEAALPAEIARFRTGRWRRC